MFNKKYIYLLLTIALLMLPMISFAATPQDVATSMMVNTFNLFILLLKTLLAILWPMLILLGGLLNNDFLFSGGMLTVLLNIWTAVRDFVNLMFVLGLLAVAIANILGVGKDTYAIKSILPKIAIALIAVNFSFLACKVVLDAVNITTTAIFAIPLASDSLKVKYGDPNSADRQKLEKDICTVDEKSNQKVPTLYFLCEEKTSGASTTSSATSAPAPKKTTTTTPAESVKTYNEKFNQLGKDMFTTFGARNAGLVMAVELMNITELPNLKGDGTITDLKGLSMQTIFALIFGIIYAASFVSLFAVMLVRVIVLWITIATSPLSFLGMAFEMVKTKLGDKDPFFKLFFNHALAPIYVAIVLTVGMIMISQIKQITPGSMMATDPSGFGTLVNGVSSLQTMMAGLATAGFIWMASNLALKGTMADKAVGAIMGGVEGFGKELIKVPLNLPILPVKGPGGAGNVGLGGLAGALGSGGPLAKWNQDQQSEATRLLGGGKKEQYKNELEKATTEAEVRKATANILLTAKNADVEVEAETQKAIAKKFSEKQVKLASFTPPNGTTMEKFMKDLEKGEVKKEKLKEFYDKNKEGALKGETATSESKADGLKQADNSVTAAKNAGLSDDNSKVKAVADARGALAKETDPAKIKEAKKKLDEATTALVNATTALNKATVTIKTSADGKTATIEDADANSIRKTAGEVEPDQIKRLPIIKNILTKTGVTEPQLTALAKDLHEKPSGAVTANKP